MGLDMYLHSKVYVGNKYRKPAQQVKVTYPTKETDVMFKVDKNKLDSSKIAYIEYDVAYWRKANMIHEWFVNNVQGGEDDCKDYYVDYEKLEELVTLCKEVLKVAKTDKPLPKDTKDYMQWADIKITNEADLAELLPTAEGFFFGGTEYGGDYLYDIKNTVEQLEPLLEKREDGYYAHPGELYYRASW